MIYQGYEFTEQELDAFLAMVLVTLGPKALHPIFSATAGTAFVRLRNDWYRDDPRVVKFDTHLHPTEMRLPDDHPLGLHRMRQRYEDKQHRMRQRYEDKQQATS